METLRERLETIEQLPTTPGVLGELSLALGDPETSSADIERIVSVDTALSMAVLRRSGAADLAGVVPTGSLRDAVTRIGKKELIRIAMAHQAASLLAEAGKAYGLAPGDAWRGAYAGAVVASLIGEQTGLADPEVSFTAALLRDCGKLAMDYLFEVNELREALKERPKHTGIVELERAQLGFDHAEVGAELAEVWGLSPALVTAIRHHHSPSEEAGPLADVVHCADVVCAMVGMGVGLDGLAYVLDLGARQRVGLQLEEVHRYLAELAQHVEEMEAVLAGARH